MMKCLTIRLTTAVKTFAIGLAAISWLRTPARNAPVVSAGAVSVSINKTAPPTADSAPVPDVPIVKFCDLVRRPKRFDNKLVQTTAVFIQARDMATLMSPACDDNRAYVDVTFSEAAPVNVIREILDGGPKKRHIFSDVEVTAVGRFKANGGGEYRTHGFEVHFVKNARRMGQ